MVPDEDSVAALREALERLLAAFTGQHTNGLQDAQEKREATQQARAALARLAPPPAPSSSPDGSALAREDRSGA